MKDYDARSFGEIYADEYDALHNPGTTRQAVELISELAGSAKILELAIGTGRVALPLVERGHTLHGLEVSPEMIAKLREKPGGADIPVLIADMADFASDETFDFAFLIFNTLFNLTSQEDQVSCFQNVAACLTPGGKFLVETFVPDVSRFRDHQSVVVNKLDKDQLWIEAVAHDPVTQRIDAQRVRFSSDGFALKPLPMRYAWPAEIDLMAKLAGLERVARWGSWTRDPFTPDSKMHVSVYEKARV